MALMVLHLLGFSYFLPGRLSGFGAHNLPCIGPEGPFLRTDKVYPMFHFCQHALLELYPMDKTERVHSP